MLEMREIPASESNTDNSFVQEKCSILSRALRIKVNMPTRVSNRPRLDTQSLYSRGRGAVLLVQLRIVALATDVHFKQ